MKNLLDFMRTVLEENYDPNTGSFKTAVSIMKTFMTKNSDLFELDREVNPAELFKKNGQKILNALKSSKLSRETKRKILFIFALMLQKLKLTGLHAQYLKLYMTIKKKIVEDRKSNEPRSSNEVACLNVSLKQLRNQPVDTNDMDPKSLLYNLLIFVDETPRLDYRLLIYKPNYTQRADRKFKNKNERINVLTMVEGKCVLILNEYKTVSKYGPWFIPVQHKQVCEQIKKFIKYHNLKMNDYIFYNKSGKVFASNKFSEYIQRIFKEKIGTKITINCLRKIKENELFHQNPKILNMSITEREKWVEKYFKHTLENSMLYYSRVNKPKNEIEMAKNNTETPQEADQKTIFIKPVLSETYKKYAKKNHRVNEKENTKEQIFEFSEKLSDLMDAYGMNKKQVRKLMSNQALI